MIERIIAGLILVAIIGGAAWNVWASMEANRKAGKRSQDKPQ